MAVLHGKSLSDAVRFANACGTIAVSRLGTMTAMLRQEDLS
jgi:sugar/nucleoside kinase (ribokinase family)